jgi:hypothetical protein
MEDVFDVEGVRDLYAGPPDGFVRSRSELAARLTDAGEAEAAAAVRGLRRPTVAAWAVDAIARNDPDDLEALIRAGEDLGEAQRSMTAGGGAERLRAATEERRALVDRLTRSAAEALSDAGLSAARGTLDKVTDTLTAIASDTGAAALVRRGVLAKELPPPAGFGDALLDSALLASVTTLPRRGAIQDREGPAQARKEEERRRRAEQLAAAASDLEGEADRLESGARSAASAAAKARKAAEAARRRAQAARRKAQKAAGS